jgi:hypothetical protein
MFDLHPLCEFSRNHCVAICTFLVPANLLTTLQTILLIGLHRSQVLVWQSAGLASFFAIVMLLHVFTWFLIGVVMAPTYILLAMACLCLSINLWAIVHPLSMLRSLSALMRLQSLKLPAQEKGELT